jgi:hypothetical protein
VPLAHVAPLRTTSAWRARAPLLNRQSCDRDYNSSEEPADAAEHQNIVDFGHGIPRDGGRDGGAKAALFQAFVGDGVRPVLRQKIKSNQIISRRL